ncbi:MAG: D-alanyl-D-alanine carboxypeptidase family protein [Anaerosomatales bacterium]|nr:D-alanyl-D-alanine carboxypeptidase family protein [Anaerosomatales bacterium]
MRRLAVALLFAGAAFVATSATVASGAVRPSDRVAGVPLAERSAWSAAAPDLDMPAGVLVTADGRELWSRAADAPRAMASTTKIMTAVVVLESVADLEERVRVTAAADAVGESEAGLLPGESYTVRSLLEAMLVHSGNDAATALAEHVAGSQAAFVEKMNEKARELDLRETQFTNPHGLDEPGHHTSARDLATLARYALQIPEFRRIVGMPSMALVGERGERRFENSNKLIGRYPGATGVKTGWTNKAGYCLVASAERDGVSLVCVVLGTRSESERFAEARALLDWGFEHYRRRQVASAGTTVAALPVRDYLDVAVPAVVAETTSTAVFDLEGPLETTVTVPAAVDAPVRRGERVGTLGILQGDTLVAQVPVVAAGDVEAPAWYERLSVWVARAWRRLFGGPQQAARQVIAPAVP